MTDESDWAKADAAAQEADQLRTKLSYAAERAIQHGVSRDWVNGRLPAMGIKPVTGISEYRMNIPLTGSYGWRCKAGSRVEAVQRFLEQVQRIAEAGKITADGSYDNVYDVKFDEPVTASDVVFYAGPEDTPTEAAEELTLDELKTAIRAFLKAAVAEQNWGHSFAQAYLDQMGLPRLPELLVRFVKVPVSGTAEVNVRTFEDSTDEEIQASALATLGRFKSVHVRPEEVGEAQYTGRMLPSDEDAEEEDYEYGD